MMPLSYLGTKEMSMDFNQTRYRNIDNRDSMSKAPNKSIIDSYTTKLRLILRDPTLSPGFVAKALKHLSESDIMDFADYAARKGEHPGKAFVGLCEKTMQYKSLS